MPRGYKIFPRGKKFRDNWDETFGNKPSMKLMLECWDIMKEAEKTRLDKPGKQGIITGITE